MEEKKISCPSCGAVIKHGDINSETDLARCAACGETFALHELQAASGDFAFDPSLLSGKFAFNGQTIDRKPFRKLDLSALKSLLLLLVLALVTVGDIALLIFKTPSGTRALAIMLLVPVAFIIVVAVYFSPEKLTFANGVFASTRCFGLKTVRFNAADVSGASFFLMDSSDSTSSRVRVALQNGGEAELFRGISESDAEAVCNFIFTRCAIG